MKRICLHILFLLISGSLLAQFKTEKELVARIKSFSSDEALRKFIKDHKLSLETKDTSRLFHAARMKVDVFKKNLFGDSENEIILQLREDNVYSVNFYYYKDSQLLKVPSLIERYFDSEVYSAYRSFSFALENVFKENEYCLVANDFSDYVRTSGTQFEILRIFPDSIQSIYSFEGRSFSYSGGLNYFHRSDRTHEFKLLNSSYPKALVIKTEFDNTDIQSKNDSEDIKSGIHSWGTKEETIAFKDKGVDIIASKENKKEEIFISSIGDLGRVKKEKCDTLTTLYIAEDFFSTYLENEKEPSNLVPHNSSEITYLVGCHAYLKGRTLIITSKDVKGKFSSYSYTLKPSISELIKPGINLKRLYHLGSGYQEGEIVYFKKDTLLDRRETEKFNFADPSTVYKIESNQTITFLNHYGQYFIPLKKIENYLKPEIIGRIKNYSKE